MSLPPSAPASPDQNSEKKPWQVGTLTYTTAGLIVLFAWLLWGDFAWQMKERAAPNMMQVLLKKFAASDTLSGILIGSLPAAVGLFFGPIISYKSDRHRGRWGRRIPYLLMTTPFTSLAMVGLAFSPWLGEHLHHLLGPNSPGLNPSILIVFGLCWTVFEFATIAANNIFAALANDVVPQAIIGRFFGMFRVMSLVAGMLFSRLLFGKTEEHYTIIFIGFAILYGVGVTLMCLRVKEGQYPPPPPVEYFHGQKQGFFAAAKTYLHECFGHKYYIWFFVAVALGYTCLVPVNLFQIPYAKKIGMDLDTFGNRLFWTYVISLCLAYPLGVIADKIHPLRLTMITVGLYAAVATWAGLFASNPENFSVAIIAHGVISGAFFTAVASLPQRLLSKGRFAELYSAYMIVYSICFIILPFLLGPFLEYTNHEYRYTFLIGAGIAFLDLCVLVVLYRKFMARGGSKGYVAPGDESEIASIPAQ